MYTAKLDKFRTYIFCIYKTHQCIGHTHLICSIILHQGVTYTPVFLTRSIAMDVTRVGIELSEDYLVGMG